MGAEIENLNPNVYKKCAERKRTVADDDDNVSDPFDEREIFGESLRSVLRTANRYSRGPRKNVRIIVSATTKREK